MMRAHSRRSWLTFLLLALALASALFVQPRTTFATAAWLWHGGNIVAGGVTTRTVLPGQDVTVWLKVGYNGYVNQARIYYTTNGTEPQGSYDTVSNGSKVTMTFSHTEADPGGTVAWYSGVIPAQAQGTQVRYKLSAWHSGGGDIVYAESSSGKLLTSSSEATSFGYYVGAFVSPEWAKNAVIYQVFIDRFFDGSTGNNIDCPISSGGYCVNDNFNWNGGDLAGVQARLDYLQSLGVNTLWLSPVYENPPTQIGSEYDSTPGVIKNYHGYEAKDFYDVEDNFGSNGELESRIDAAHAANMRVILDFVPNHSSNQHPYFIEASDTCSGQYMRWYKFTSCSSGHNQWWGDNDSYSNFFGVKEMPQLDNDYGPARNATIDQALVWVNTYDIDGLRLDYAPGPSHSFWMALRAAVKAADPDVFLVGEIWTEGGAAERKSYEGELDSALSFDMYYLFKDFFAKRSMNVDSFDSGLAYYESYFNAEYIRTTFLDNHDVDRFLFEAGQNSSRLKLAYLAQLTLAGPPVLYYGSEVGLSQSEASAGKPERSRSRMPWGNYLSSPPTGWNAAQNTDVREMVKLLIQQRNAISALRTGSRTALWRHNSDGTYAYRRTDASSNVVVAFNNSDTTRTLSIPNLPGATIGWADGTYVEDKLSGRTFIVTGGKVNITLNGSSGALLVALPAASATRVDFSVSGYSTSWGQSMYVVGSSPELGSWDPNKAVPLSYVNSSTWSGPAIFGVSKGTSVEYKYIVRQGSTTIWESGANRVYSVPSSGTHSVSGTWRP